MGIKFQNIDLYGVGIKLNMKGREEFKTVGGACVSLLLILMVTMYTAYRGAEMAIRYNTQFNDISESIGSENVTIPFWSFAINNASSDQKHGNWSATLDGNPLVIGFCDELWCIKNVTLNQS